MYISRHSFWVFPALQTSKSTFLQTLFSLFAVFLFIVWTDSYRTSTGNLWNAQLVGVTSSRFKSVSKALLPLPFDNVVYVVSLFCSLQDYWKTSIEITHVQPLSSLRLVGGAVQKFCAICSFSNQTIKHGSALVKLTIQAKMNDKQISNALFTRAMNTKSNQG